MPYHLPVGANISDSGTFFRVWASSVDHVDVVLYDHDQPSAVHPMKAVDDGFFELMLPDVGAGTRYMYRLDGTDDRPDPASRFQPLGVHGPSEVVDPQQFHWRDQNWRGVPAEQATIYELHVGTFTAAGTFDAAIDKLDELVELGVSLIEILPVADFPGERNWGYDGVCLFAPSRVYGGPEGLRRLVDAAHQRGLGVMLDLVYNHFGPDGNYLRQFSEHYFTHHHKTPWGDALNFDDVESAQVRQFFIANACYWAHEYHVDGFRLDATHEIKDDSKPHILADIVSSVHASLPADRSFLFMAEDDRNDPMLVRPAPGYGLDTLWADDFHHEMRVALTGEREGYFGDFAGTTEELAKTLEQGWFYTGQHSENNGRPRGAPTSDLPTTAFLYCIQNHDQVGNRALGDRLSAIIGLDAYRAASALLLLSPYVPMLWQGQEWAASTPFLFFTDHNEELGKLITEGRRREFAYFAGFAGAQVPDPQAEETFTRSKLNWQERSMPPHSGMLALYQDLLRLRREVPALQNRARSGFAAQALGEDGLALQRHGGDQSLMLLLNLRGANTYAMGEGAWQVLLSTEDARYGGVDGAHIEGGVAVFAGPGALLLEAK